MNKYFFITIDTEADNQWDNAQICSTKNAKYLPRFQNLAEKYGFKPVWLTTYEMAENEDFVKYFKLKQEKGLCEIGMHLHAWNTPPEHKLDKKTNERSYLIEYPLDIMEEKIKNIDNFLTKKFGIKPISHRAGRWGMNDNYYKLLYKYGYKIDVSVTPHINWQNSVGETGMPGSNYKNYSEKEYITNNILEVPMTIRKIFTFQPKRVNSIKRFFRELQLLFTGRYQWIRPDNSFSLKGMLKVVSLCDKNNEYIMFMIHSSELMPNGSPNFKDKESIENLYKVIDKLFENIKARGYVGCTLREYYEKKVKKN